MGAAHQPCTVRTAQPGDLVAVLAVHARKNAGDRSRMVASPLESETWHGMMERDGLTVYLAEIEGRTVGTATSMVMPNLTYACAPTAFIEALVVIPRHRRPGVATALVTRTLEDARAAGCNKVQLLSHKRHAVDGAHRLYESLGFEAEAEGFRLCLREVPEALRVATST